MDMRTVTSIRGSDAVDDKLGVQKACVWGCLNL